MCIHVVHLHPFVFIYIQTQTRPSFFMGADAPPLKYWQHRTIRAAASCRIVRCHLFCFFFLWLLSYLVLPHFRYPDYRCPGFGDMVRRPESPQPPGGSPLPLCPPLCAAPPLANIEHLFDLKAKIPPCSNPAPLRVGFFASGYPPVFLSLLYHKIAQNASKTSRKRGRMSFQHRMKICRNKKWGIAIFT